MGFDFTKAPNNFVRGDVEIGGKGHRDGRVHIGWITFELKQDAKKELSIIALSGFEVDVAEPFDNTMEWLDFRVRMMDQNLFESHRVAAKF